MITLLYTECKRFVAFHYDYFRKPGVAVKINIHEKNQFLDFSGRMGHDIMVGEKVSSQINIHESNQILKKYTDPHDTHGQSSESYDTTCSQMEYDSCIYKALTRIMIKETEDKCLVPWFPKNYSMEQIGSHQACTLEKDVNASYWIYWNRITNQMNDCNKPCKSVVLNIGGKNYQHNRNLTYGTALFYFTMTSTHTTEHFLYSPTSLFAEIGGYLGLLLGYSCLDLASTLRDISEKIQWRRNAASK